MTPKKYKEIEVEWIKWRKRPSKPESFTNHKEAIEFAYYHATKIKKKHKALAKISDMQEQQIKELKEKTCHADWWKENEELHKQIKELKELLIEILDFDEITNIDSTDNYKDGAVDLVLKIKQALK